MELGCKTRQSGPRLCVWRAMLYYLRWNWLVYISLSPHWEKAMAPPSSTLALKIPRTEESGRLQSMGSLSWTPLSDFTFTFHFPALKKEMATHSSVLAWRIPGTGEPGGLPSMGSQRVGHNWSDLAAASPYWAISNLKRWCCESAALYMPANLEISAVATGLEKVSFHSNPKERQCQRMPKLPHNCTHLTR